MRFFKEGEAVPDWGAEETAALCVADGGGVGEREASGQSTSTLLEAGRVFLFDLP